MSSEPDLEGYDADTSICVSDGRSDTPHMTTSDDLLLNPVFWNLEQPLVSVETVLTTIPDPVSTTILDPESVTEPESELEPLVSVETVLTTTILEPESVTEPESEPKATPNNITSLPVISADPESVTEPESEPEATPNNVQLTSLPVIPDPESVTEPESETDTAPPSCFNNTKAQEDRLDRFLCNTEPTFSNIQLLEMTCELSNIETRFFDKEETKFWVIGELMWDHCDDSLNCKDLDNQVHSQAWNKGIRERES
ncbi:hypothetical protein EDB19DRAFT_1835931 [Suillus lakei]|nr:hypothetical protein EDB19DRAFT_1835931 [Suillus lakei]